MTLPIYPGRDILPGLAYGQKWTPKAYNQTSITATGVSITVPLSPYPTHTFELDYEILRAGVPPFKAPWTALNGLELKTLMGLFLAMSGSNGRFLYRNPNDNSVFQNIIGVGDGTTTRFILTRNYGANGNYGVEPIGQVNPAYLFDVYLNGSSSPMIPTRDYTVDTTTPGANAVVFTSAPPNGQNIAVDMSYFYYCRFDEDTNTFEKFADQMWNSTVVLHSCPAGS